MRTSVSFFALALLIATGQAALPVARYPTHREHTLRNGRRAVSFHAPSQFETFADGVDHADLTARGPRDPKALGLSYISSRLPGTESILTSSYDGDAASYVYVRQAINGIPVANAVANVVVNKDGKIAAFGNNFVNGASSRLAKESPTLTAEQAIERAEEQLGGKWDGTTSKIEYVHTDDGGFVLSRSVQLWENDDGHLLEAFVDAHTGDVVLINDFTASATYKALPPTKLSPLLGFETFADPQDLIASPSGWHTIPGSSALTQTAGNNVISYKTSTTGTTVESSTGTYNYTWASASSPSVSPNVDVARVNAFYIGNLVHDVTYRYGFTESAFNFQQAAAGGTGGVGNDRVLISVQDSAGTNNADFTTPADGSSGRMRMYQWTYTTPRRDGALEADIVIHEYTHGVSNRLTGGGTGRCLTTTEAGGMGEGWSDALAEWFGQAGPTLTNYVLGAYVINSSAGIRSYPYSTSNTTNPLTYGSLKTLNEVHAIGEVWANILHNVHNSLITTYGFSSDARTNPSATGGNAKFLHLFIDSLAIQPCNPTLPTARDAWIQADANRYAGANKCLLWKAFASRGLGTAAASYTNSATVPSGC